MKVRIISAIVALIIVIPLIYLGGYPFAIGCGILSILGYVEILKLKKSHQEIPNIVKVLGLISLLYLVLGNYGETSLVYSLSYDRVLIPLVLLLIPTVFYKKDKYKIEDAFYLLSGIYLIGLFFNLLIIIRDVDVFILLYLISVTIFTDTFAYAIGCLIGKHKMSPKISPKKSWEGAIAGVIGGVSIATIIYHYLVEPINFKIILITIILSIVGQIGDLVYSKIKRENDIKDFSNIMPGHGGILDRIDSLSFVIFTYVIIIMFL